MSGLELVPAGKSTFELVAVAIGDNLIKAGQVLHRRFAVVPIVFAYVLVVFFSQHLGWKGVTSIYEQHAFLLPVPFVAWK